MRKARKTHLREAGEVVVRSGLVPRPLAVLGITGAGLILLVGAIELLGVITPYSMTTMLLALPIAVYEMVLAGRLIITGFNPVIRPVPSEPSPTSFTTT